MKKFMSFMESVKMWYIRSLLVLKISRYAKDLCLGYNMFLFSLYIYLNIFRSNKFVVSYAIVNIEKCAETGVIVQGEFLLRLPKSHIRGKIDV